MAVAIVHDVEIELGRPISDATEVEQVERWLERAERQIVKRLGPVAALDQDAVRDVEAMAVAAKALNPQGASSESVDDYTYRLPEETRRVTILDEWWDQLSPVATIAEGPYVVPLGGADVWP